MMIGREYKIKDLPSGCLHIGFMFEMQKARYEIIKTGGGCFVAKKANGEEIVFTDNTPQHEKTIKIIWTPSEAHLEKKPSL